MTTYFPLLVTANGLVKHPEKQRGAKETGLILAGTHTPLLPILRRKNIECSLSWIALARTYYTVLNNSDKNGHRFLCLDIGGKVYSFLTLTVMLAVSRHIWPFLCWNTSVPSLFNLNGCWILSKAFSVSIEMIQWFLFFILLIWLLKSSLQPQNKSHLILLVYDLFNVFLNLVC